MNKLLSKFTNTPFNKYFWAILLIKIIFSALFASSYMTQGFLPFVSYFTNSSGNPYEYFYGLHEYVFPYPSLMLLLFSVPLSIAELIYTIFGVNNIFLKLFLMRVPILVADVVIYYIICKWLPTKEMKVLFLYFASPILFYINYYHGQLDVIPTCFLFASLYLLFKKKVLLSYILLGLGFATKTHLLIALPFYLIYLYRSKISLLKLIVFNLIAIASFVLPNIFFFSKGFLATVFNNSEQLRIFFLNVPFGYQEIALYITPAVILGVLYRFLSYKRYNNDSLILSLGLVYTALIAFVPPMQGWFYWSVPFLVYFFCKYTNANATSYWMMNIFYLLFFASIKDSDILDSASTLFPTLAAIPVPYELLASTGSNPLLLQNLMFTGLEVSVLMNALWCYRIGMHYNNLYIENDKPYILGIGGNSGVGKSTLTRILQSTLGQENIVVLNGDDAHKWERGNKQWNVFTHLNPSSNKIHQDFEHVYALHKGKAIERVGYDHKTGLFSNPSTMQSKRFILLQGLHPFFLKSTRDLFDLKIFLETSDELYKKWKIERDISKRGYKKSAVEKEIVRREKDFIKYVAPQKNYADWVISYDLQKKVLQTNHRLSNNLELDPLIKHLKNIRTLTVVHDYNDIDHQIVTISGTISSNRLQKIYYMLYPNMDEVITHTPKFTNNSNGISQLLFLCLINDHYLRKKQRDESNY
jgi:uridine kinase